jgi:glutathione S-transferase
MDSPNVNPYKLYYAPGACSLASHISLEMSKQKYERECDGGIDKTTINSTDGCCLHAVEKVEFPSHKLSDGTDYYKINPGGYVPALRLPNDEILLEGVAILSYIADKVLFFKWL